MVSRIERDNPKSCSEKTERERYLARLKLERVDVDNLVQMQEILKMEKDPPNMVHLADISEKTGISDIIQHYKKSPEERDSRIILDGKHVVAVFDVSPFDPSRIGIPDDGAWKIKSAFLNRLVVRSDKQNCGIGTKAVAYAEDVAFREHDYPTLIAGIILDDEQVIAYDEAIENKNRDGFIQKYMRTDARGTIYLVKRGWEFSGVLRKQGGFKEGVLNSVLLIQKDKEVWEKEQNQAQNKNPLKDE